MQRNGEPKSSTEIQEKQQVPNTYSLKFSKFQENYVFSHYSFSPHPLPSPTGTCSLKWLLKVPLSYHHSLHGFSWAFLWWTEMLINSLSRSSHLRVNHLHGKETIPWHRHGSGLTSFVRNLCKLNRFWSLQSGHHSTGDNHFSVC